MSEHRETRRQALVLAALAEFSECGYERARMESIARRAGMGKSTVYEYFASKLDVAAAAADYTLGVLETHVEAIFSRDLPLRQNLTDFLAFMFSMLRDMGGHILMMQGEAPVSDLIRRCALQAHAIVRTHAGAAIARAQERGELDPKVSAEPLVLLMLMLPNPQLPLLVPDSCLETCIEQIVDLIFRGAARREN